MMNWLDRGGELEKAIGMKVSDKPPEETDFDKVKGPMLFLAPIKSKARAEEKVNADYKTVDSPDGDWSQLTDLVRATIAVDNYDDISKVADTLKKHGLKLAKPPKDRFQKPTPVGYRDVLLNVEYPNGHIGELQLHVKPMLKAKNAGHKHYETMRTIDAKMEKEKRTTRTDEEEKSMQEALQKSKELYESAWSEAMKKAAMKIIGKDTQTKYFEYDGKPVYCKYKETPMKMIDGKAKPMYNTWKFVHSAIEINKKEFDKMVEEQQVDE
jgi:hypothetical protein